MSDPMSHVDRDCLVAALLVTAMTSNLQIGAETATERFASALKEVRRKGGSSAMWRAAAPPSEGEK